MKEKAVIGLISAMMILIAMPTYLSYIQNSREYAEEDNIMGFADETTDIVVDEVKGEIVGAVIGIVVSLAFALVAFLKGLGLI